MKKFLSILLVYCLSTSLAIAKTYMVAIGIANYPGSKMDLHISDHDAVSMKTLYEKNNKAEVSILTNAEAKLSEVINQMSGLFGKAGNDDSIVLYFSGHGVPGGFVCYDRVLEYEAINKIMASCPAKNKMVFSDACFSGKARKSNNRSYTHYDTNIMFFLSSRTDETSQERRGWDNSLFTAYLERGLTGGADVDRNRIITALELFTFVSDGVKKASGDKQHPVMWGNFDNDMPIMTW